MASGTAALVGSLLSAGAGIYQSRQQGKLAKKQEKRAEEQAQMAEKQAAKEKKQQIKMGGEEAKRRNRMLKAYQKPPKTLVGQTQDTYKLG